MIPLPDPMYHTDNLLRKHHLLIEDRSGNDTVRVRLVDWQTYAPAHPDAALEYLAELKHGNPGFPGEDVAAALLEWVATLPRPAEPYVRKELPPNMCFSCGGDDHDVCGCQGHWEMVWRTFEYLRKHDALPEQKGDTQ